MYNRTNTSEQQGEHFPNLLRINLTHTHTHVSVFHASIRVRIVYQTDKSIRTNERNRKDVCMIPKRRKEKGNSNIELQWSIQSTTLYRTKSKRRFSSQRLIYSHIKQQVILNVVSYNVRREGKTDNVERENKAQTSHIQLRKLYEMFIEMKLSFSTLPRFWYHRPIPLSSSIPTANNVSNRNTYRF